MTRGVARNQRVEIRSPGSGYRVVFGAKIILARTIDDIATNLPARQDFVIAAKLELVIGNAGEAVARLDLDIAIVVRCRIVRRRQFELAQEGRPDVGIAGVNVPSFGRVGRADIDALAQRIACVV